MFINMEVAHKKLMSATLRFCKPFVFNSRIQIQYILYVYQQYKKYSMNYDIFLDIRPTKSRIINYSV